MYIKNIAHKILDFTIKRIAELSGLSLIIISILLFISLTSYNPDDPNFIFSDKNRVINNLLGVRGSYTADLFFQSIGLMSMLVSITVFFTGINLIISKNFIMIFYRYVVSIKNFHLL